MDFGGISRRRDYLLGCRPMGAHSMVPVERACGNHLSIYCLYVLGITSISSDAFYFDSFVI